MSPWPEIEALRCRQLARGCKPGKQRTFSYEQCTRCQRWFGSERSIKAARPTLCTWVCNVPKRPKPTFGKVPGAR